GCSEGPSVAHAESAAASATAAITLTMVSASTLITPNLFTSAADTTKAPFSQRVYLESRHLALAIFYPGRHIRLPLCPFCGSVAATLWPKTEHFAAQDP